MGERTIPDAGDTDGAPRPRFRWLVPVVAGILLVAALARPGDLDRRERTAYLGAASLAGDLDLVWSEEDEARQRKAFGGAEEEHAGPELGPGSRIAVSSVVAVVLAPAAVVGGPGTCVVWQALLVGLGLILAGRSFERRLGSGAGPLVAVLAVGSVVAISGLRLWPQTMASLFVLCGFAIAFGAAAPRWETMPEIYEGAAVEGPTRFLLRWIGAGALLGAAVAVDPLLLPLAIAPAVAIPEHRRRRGAPLALGAAAMVALAFGLPCWLGSLGDLPQNLPGSEVLEWRLWLWNGVALGAGRHAGVAWTLVPLVLVLLTGCGRGRDGRWAIAVGSVVTGLAVLALDPFGWSLLPYSVGPGRLLPVAVALWFVVDEVPKRWVLVVALAGGGAALWPLWWPPGGGLVDEGRATWVPTYLEPWSPLETTQEGAPLGPTVDADPFDLRLVGDEAVVDRGFARWRFLGGRPVELVLSSPDPLEAVMFEVEEAAGTEIELTGAEPGQIVLMPNGSGGFFLRFDGTPIVHPVAGGETRAFHHFVVTFPEAPFRPIRVQVTDAVLATDG